MTHPAVDTVLSAIKTNWSAGTYADIPIERIDRDNSDLLDGNIRSHTAELRENNYVGATWASFSNAPIGTEYDHDHEEVVGVRVEGLHESEYGLVDPTASLPPNTANDPVPWYRLVGEIQDAILDDRTNPSDSRSRIDWRDLRIPDGTGSAAEFGDYYRADFDVVFVGYEEN